MTLELEEVVSGSFTILSGSALQVLGGLKDRNVHSNSRIVGFSAGTLGNGSYAVIYR